MGPGRRWPADASIPLAEATRDGVPVLVPSAGAWEARFGEGHRPPRNGAWAAIPVAVGGETVGALLWSYFAPRAFDAAEAAAMAAVAQLCAQALERARLYEAEREAREAAEEANRAKTDFLSAMSHELRTPLNAIAGYVELLELGIRGPVTPAQAADLARIGHAQRVLLGLINDVLNFARLEAGRLELRDDRVPLAGVLEALDALVRPQVAARGLVYECRVDDAAPAVCGDADRIQQILLNLVSNAIKFTDPGGRVEVRVGTHSGQAAVRVQDTGRGIPPDKLEEIFDPFVQVDRHRTEQSQQGVGLGLAISRDLARSMAGDLTAESTPGEGSTFTLLLPLAPD
jgi:signal transduction histidine kinase